jgi:REP element-mobilizing transposase RayT
MIGSISNLVYHVVFGVQNQSRRITRDLKEELYAFIGNTVHSHGGAVLEIGGTPDHLHLLLQLRTEHAVCDSVWLIKSTSARWMDRRARDGRRFAWQPGFGAFTVGEAQLPAVRRWLRDQARHHRGHSFGDELMVLVRQHRVALEAFGHQ